ncbi:MAG: hypothetical protein ACUVS4_07555 [Chloroflexaceae bacterium]
MTSAYLERANLSFGARRLAAWLALTLALLVAGLWNLNGGPVWWDEGWTLSVARTWAETGHYGRLRDGHPAAPGLEAAFTTTLPVGLSMRLFGVGLWQGRLFGVLCAVASLLLLAALGARLNHGRLAWATAGAALLLSIHPQIQPLLQGRQVLAEMPMLVYLLAGYLGLWATLGGRWGALLPTVLLLGAAWISKGQTAPFLLASLLAPAVVALLMRRWRVASIFALALGGAVLSAHLLRRLGAALLLDPAFLPEPVEGLLGMVAIVFTVFHRLYALENMLFFGFPALCGLLWGARRLWHERASAHAGAPAWYLRLTLLAFCGSWLAWFLALSVGVPRYMAVPCVVASLFVAELLYDLSGGFALRERLHALGALLTLRRPSRAGVAALLALLLVAAAAPLTMLSLVKAYATADHSAQRIAAWLNAQPPGSRVETYESELHFLLNQPYTFPPDQVHVALGKRYLEVDLAAPVDYDPRASDPDFLVIGGFGHDLYLPIVATGQFRLVAQEGIYRLYARVR